jgi:hypothetical protein
MTDDSEWDVGAGSHLGGTGPVLLGQESWGAEEGRGGDVK